MKTVALLLLLATPCYSLGLPKKAEWVFTGEPTKPWADRPFGGEGETVVYETRPYYYWYEGSFWYTSTVWNPPQLNRPGHYQYLGDEGDEVYSQWCETVNRWIIVRVKPKEKK